MAGFFLLLLPGIQYVAVARMLHIDPAFYKLILGSLSPIELFLLFFPIIAGIGLLSVTRWGWYAAMGYALLLTLYNAFLLLAQPGWLQLVFSVQTAAGSLLLYYLFSPDTMAPFFAHSVRGFRAGRRRTTEGLVTLDGESRTATNISSHGAYVQTESVYAVGQAVQIILPGAEEARPGSVVRTDAHGIGISFLD